MTSTTPPPQRRNPVLVVSDIVASVVLLVLVATVALLVITYALGYAGIQAECGTGPYEGIVCNAVVLNIIVFGLIAIAVLALFLAFGMFIVNLIRKRYTLWWPLGALALILGSFYLGSWIAGMTVPA